MKIGIFVIFFLLIAFSTEGAISTQPSLERVEEGVVKLSFVLNEPLTCLERGQPGSKHLEQALPSAALYGILLAAKESGLEVTIERDDCTLNF
jgi:hypothetical protein